MDISVPSRFACLKIEDDDFRPGTNKSKRKTESKLQNKKTNTPNCANQPSKKSSVSCPKGQTTQTNSKKNKSKNKNEHGKQWEEWKQKDDELVNDNFEQQLQSAILQSKLEFEKQKKNLSVIKTDPEQSQGKKKKGKTMSLDQFLDNGSENESKEVVKVKEDDKNFFDDVIETAKQEITKEKVEENRKKRQEHFEDVISLAQCQEKLERERSKNTALEGELEEARKEIALVKKRNTTLCSMLSHGEMKDKAEVLLELERLTLVKEELTEEVGKLHKLLEQERSNKNSSVPNDNHSKHSKEKNKK